MEQNHTEYKYRTRPPRTPEQRAEKFSRVTEKYGPAFERLAKYEEPKQ